MSFALISRRIVYLVLAGFACVLILVWANEVVLPTLHIGYAMDTPEYAQAEAAGIFDASLNRGFWAEFAIEALLIIILAVAVLLGINQLLARIKYLEGFMLLCASCKKVRLGKDWIALEEYMQQRADVKISHSYCPECSARLVQPAGREGGR